MKLPLVSVIVRTCERPGILKYALKSIENQDYPNIEIVVIEDGANLAESLIKAEFSHLNIIYSATKAHVGRSCAGNIGLSMARGKYINFLDDDDLFYSNHISTLVSALEEHSEKAAYSVAKECRVRKIKSAPYYLNCGKKVRLNQPFNKALLSNKNYLPIQCVMFSKLLFEKLGGFDSALDQLEDWDLWVRYSMKTDFYYVNKVTSEYKVPVWGLKNRKRQRELDNAYIEVCNKFQKYQYCSDTYSLNRDIAYILSEYRIPLYLRCLRYMKNKLL
jgi:glycosyltransferase involved in cell wall biosynthesis